ncbi:hypothetical protein [Yersinia ruckeri]|uniref:hypothetical protein n=1 Tax=Yersinia ruckeri TaxID=29486 RepID=UPI002238EFB9|nr:hypothetical protein [Yersinia ruckeri]MCW6598680.1 hypothetical protein [Yersinia ruckeri]
MRYQTPSSFDTWNIRKSLIDVVGLTVSDITGASIERSASVSSQIFKLNLKQENPSSWLYQVASIDLDIDMDLVINRNQSGEVLLITLRRIPKCGGTTMKLLNTPLLSQDSLDALKSTILEQNSGFKDAVLSLMTTPDYNPKPSQSGQLELNLA